MPEQFDADGWASVLTLFADRKLKVAYHNPDRLPWGMYTIAGIRLDGEEVSYERQGRAAILSQGTLMALTKERAHTVEASLATDTQD